MWSRLIGNRKKEFVNGPNEPKCVSTNLVAHLLLSLCIPFVILSSATVSLAAGAIPSHLLGLTKSLLSQVQKSDFENADQENRVMSVIKRSRLKNWKGENPTVKDFSAELLTKLGLDGKKNEHKAAVAKLLASPDNDRRKQVLSQIVKLRDSNGKGKKLSPQAELSKALGTYREFMTDKLKSLAKEAAIDVGEDGDKLILSWDPKAASIIARIQFGDDQKDVILHGSATAQSEGGELRFRANRDKNPVSVIDANTKNRIRATVFGKWIDSEGAEWEISGSEGDADLDKGASKTAVRNDKIVKLRKKLEKLKAEKIYVWYNTKKKTRLVERKYKRKKSPYRYLRRESLDYNKARIARIIKEIRTLRALNKKKPIDRFDPLKTSKYVAAEQVEDISIKVTTQDGYSFSYEQAKFANKRLTARRILTDIRDLDEGGLPQQIRSQLIAKWSPPEWVELNLDYDLRSHSAFMMGKVWRLHVSHTKGLTSSSSSITRIHTPYIEDRLSFTKDEKAVCDINPQSAIYTKAVQMALRQVKSNIAYYEDRLTKCRFGSRRQVTFTDCRKTGEAVALLQRMSAELKLLRKPLLAEREAYSTASATALFNRITTQDSTFRLKQAQDWQDFIVLSWKIARLSADVLKMKREVVEEGPWRQNPEFHIPDLQDIKNLETLEKIEELVSASYFLSKKAKSLDGIKGPALKPGEHQDASIVGWGTTLDAADVILAGKKLVLLSEKHGLKKFLQHKSARGPILVFIEKTGDYLIKVDKQKREIRRKLLLKTELAETDLINQLLLKVADMNTQIAKIDKLIASADRTASSLKTCFKNLCKKPIVPRMTALPPPECAYSLAQSLIAQRISKSAFRLTGLSSGVRVKSKHAKSPKAKQKKPAKRQKNKAAIAHLKNLIKLEKINFTNLVNANDKKNGLKMNRSRNEIKRLKKNLKALE